VFHGVREEWRRFRADPPGERFARHERRGEYRTTPKRVLRFGLGVLILAVGIFLLFVPGPGLLFMVFGLALCAGESRWGARQMDRGEVWLRRQIGRVKGWIKRRRRHTDDVAASGS
jgi:hypothetical protein